MQKGKDRKYAGKEQWFPTVLPRPSNLKSVLWQLTRGNCIHVSHILPSALSSSLSYAHTLAFQLGRGQPQHHHGLAGDRPQPRFDCYSKFPEIHSVVQRSLFPWPGTVPAPQGRARKLTSSLSWPRPLLSPARRERTLFLALSRSLSSKGNSQP